MHHMILNAWRQKNLLFYAVLLPLSWLFSLIIKLRRQLYRVGLLRSRKLPVPVIVVGNINVGGSGKTPVVIWLVEQLRKLGYQPGVISRGYGRTDTEVKAVSSHSKPSEVGDEPLLIYQRSQCPVFVGADRGVVGEALLAQHAECNVIISDDGLQHYRLQRDVEIAVVDMQTLSKQLLPAGPMREPITRLASVDLIVGHGLTQAENAFAMQLNAGIFYNLAAPEKQVDADYFANKKIAAIAGIGQPDKFFKQLASMHIKAESLPYPDHHSYTEGELEKIDAEVVLMTEKDAVKCRRFAKPHYWVLPVEAAIDDALMEKLASLLNT